MGVVLVEGYKNEDGLRVENDGNGAGTYQGLNTNTARFRAQQKYAIGYNVSP